VYVERKAADRNAHIAAETSRFLNDLLTATNPEVAQGRNVTLRDLLLQASQRLDSTPVDPEVEARLRNTVGMTLYHVGNSSEFPLVLQHLRRSVDLLKKELGPAHPDSIDVQFNLARALTADATHLEEGLELCRQLLETCREHHGPEHRLTLLSAYTLGSCLANHERSSEFREQLATYTPIIANSPDVSLRLKMNWNALRMVQMSADGQLEAAAELARVILDQHITEYGEYHTLTARAYLNYGLNLGRAGQFENALRILSTAHALRLRLLGANHPDTGYSALNVATAYQALGNTDLARILFEQIRDEPNFPALYREGAVRSLKAMGAVPTDPAPSGAGGPK
jgi:tetratricopeptide (TPR) repeat protein